MTKSRTTLETLLENNTTRAITAQSLRDFIASTPLNTESAEWGSAATKDTTDLMKSESPVFSIMPTGIGLPIYSTLTSDASTTSIDLINTGLSASLDSGLYELDVCLSVAAPDGGEAGCLYSITGVHAVRAVIYGADTTFGIYNQLNTVQYYYFFQGNGYALGPFLNSPPPQTGTIHIQGIIKLNSAGIVNIQHAKIADGTSIVYAKSSLKITPIQKPVSPVFVATQSSGLDPAISGNYYENGTNFAKPAYSNLAETVWIWYGGFWAISATKNVLGSWWWSNSTITGTYTKHGSLVGTATIANV